MYNYLFYAALILFCRNSTLHYAIIGCVKALMNSPVSAILHIFTLSRRHIYHAHTESMVLLSFFSPTLQDGRAHVLVHPNAITIIAQSLKTSNARTKILGLIHTQIIIFTPSLSS